MLIRFLAWYKNIDLKVKTAILLVFIFAFAFALIEVLTLQYSGYSIAISAIFVISIMTIGVYEVLSAYNLNTFTIFSIIFGLILSSITPFIYLTWLYLFADINLTPFIHMSWRTSTFVIIAVSLVPLLFDKAFIYSRARVFTFFSLVIILLASEAAAKFMLIVMTVHFRDAVYFLLISVVTDTAASVFGKMLGKKFPWKLAKRISPNKTVVGFVFGYGFGVAFAIGAASMPTGGLFFSAGQDRMWDLRIAYGLITPLVAVLGDLFFSAIKRTLFMKDFSALIPGHGGVFDRIDSHVFVLAFTFFFYMLTIKDDSASDAVLGLSHLVSNIRISLDSYSPNISHIIPQL